MARIWLSSPLRTYRQLRRSRVQRIHSSAREICEEVDFNSLELSRIGTIRQAIEYAKRDVIADDVFELAVIAIAAFLGIAMFVALIVRPWFDRSATEGSGEVVGLLAWEVFVLAVFGTMTLVGRSNDRLKAFVVLASTGLFPVLAYVLRRSLSGRDDKLRTLLTGAMHAGLVTVFVLLVGIILAYLASTACSNYVDVLPADLRCWTQMAQISFDCAGGITQDLSGRRQLIDLLTETANILRHEVPKSLGIDSELPEPVLRRFADASAYVRGLASWVALPQAGTAENLRSELRGLIVVLLSGEFHYLPRPSEPLPDIPDRRSIRQLSVKLLVGVLPIAALISTELAHVEIGSEIRSTWLLAAIAWLAVSLITVLDPNFSENLSRTEKVIGLLRAKQD